MHKNLKNLLTGIVGVLVGFYICIIVKKLTVLTISPTISFEINPFELFSLIVTIILTIYVASTLSKVNDSEKNEKDLLINYLSNFKNDLNQKITQLLEQPEFDSVDTNYNFKIIRKKIDSIISLSVEYKFIDKQEVTSNALISSIRDIWELFTNVPKKASGRSTASVKEDIKKLRLEQVSKIEMKIIEIDKLLFQLTMKINRK